MKRTVQKIFEQDLTKEQSEYVIRTFKDIARNPSFDARKECHEYPTDSQITAIDFDHIKTIYVNTLGERNGICASFRSCDALYPTGSGMWHFIEFKDGVIDSKVVREIYEKISDSKDILMDLDILEKGYLQVDDLKSVLVPAQPGAKDFLFHTRMKKMKYVNQIEYLRNHFNFILVYNDKLYEETEQDKDGFRNAIKIGQYDKEISFLEHNRLLIKNKSAVEFMQQVIMEGHFNALIEMIVKASDCNNAEDRKLIRRFEVNIDERMELLNRCGSVRNKIGTKEEINAMTGEQFLKALYIYSIYNKNVKIELKKLSQIIDLENHKYDSFIEKVKNTGNLIVPENQDIDSYIRKLIFRGEFEDEYKTVMFDSDVYLQQFIDAMAENSKIPKRLFYLYQFEGKYFKEVYTYSETEFNDIFVKTLEKEESVP